MENNPISRVPAEEAIIVNMIYVLRDKRVILDIDLAALYGLDLALMRRQVRRVRNKYSEDYFFELFAEEYAALRNELVEGRYEGAGERMPHAFTEHGVAMLGSLLKSPVAIAVNSQIIRVFTGLHERKVQELKATDAASRESQMKLDILERKLGKQEGRLRKTENEIDYILSMLDKLLEPFRNNGGNSGNGGNGGNEHRRRIGFRRPDEPDE